MQQTVTENYLRITTKFKPNISVLFINICQQTKMNINKNNKTNKQKINKIITKKYLTQFEIQRLDIRRVQFTYAQPVVLKAFDMQTEEKSARHVVFFSKAFTW